jgi:hypothetical protein
VQVIRGEPVGASDVQPPTGAVDADRGLIDVHDVRQHDQRLDQLLDLDERGGRLGQRGGDPAGGRPGAGQVGDQLRGPSDRDVLEHQQVYRQRAQARPVLSRPTDSGRGRGQGHRAAPAAAAVQPMLDDHRADRRDVVHLAAHHGYGFTVGEVRPAASTAAREVLDHLVRVIHQCQRAARRTRLLTRLAPRTSPGAPRCHLRAIGRRRL